MYSVNGKCRSEILHKINKRDKTSLVKPHFFEKEEIMTDFPKPDSLRKAAEAIEKHKAARDKLSEAQDNLRAEAIREDVASREVHLHLSSAIPNGDFPPGNANAGGGDLPPVDRRPVVVANHWWSNPAWAVISGIALALALLAIVFCFVNHEDASVGKQTASTALTVAMQSKTEAGEAKATANKFAADVSQARADSGNAVTLANQSLAEAKAAAARCAKSCPEKRKTATKPKAKAKVPAVALCSGQCAPHAIAAAIWLWHDPYATATAPKPCVIASGDGAGLPPYCSGFKVKSAVAGETKHQWLLRVGGGHKPTDTGFYQQVGKQQD